MRVGFHDQRTHDFVVIENHLAFDSMPIVPNFFEYIHNLGRRSIFQIILISLRHRHELIEPKQLLGCTIHQSQITAAIENDDSIALQCVEQTLFLPSNAAGVISHAEHKSECNEKKNECLSAIMFPEYANTEVLFEIVVYDLLLEVVRYF